MKLGMQHSPQPLKLELRGFNVFGASVIQEAKFCIIILHPSVSGLFLFPESDPEIRSQGALKHVSVF